MTVVWDMAQVQTSALFSALHPVLATLDWPRQTWPSLADCQTLLDSLPQAVMTASGARLRVTSQAVDKPDDWRQGYEPHIYLTGELQTRLESWHDLFNLLVWAAFPQTKAALNARHYQLQKARAEAGHLSAPRDAAQDALTQFDETGVIVLSSDATLLNLVEDFAWKELFWARREACRAHMHCLLFGHGLMEKALHPYIGMTGKAVLLHVPSAVIASPHASVDTLLAERIQAHVGFDSPRALSPVPVLGFPGMWPENQHESFYENENYFRPGRAGR